MAAIDLNADLGENAPDRVVSDDVGMLRVVTSANVSCGAHAGTAEGIRSTLAAAVADGVAIGAHLSYVDHEGFGRRALEVDAGVLQAQLEEQIGFLVHAASDAGGRAAYVKPHGALYNVIARDEAHARAVVAAVRAIDPALVLLGLPGGVAAELAVASGLAVAGEAFADRGYLPDGRLVPRTEPGAVLHDPDEVAERMLRLAVDGVVRAVDGTDVRIDARSICVHGDSPGAVAMAAAVRRALEDEGVVIAPFA